jgi:gamma-glutamylcyclotransferase (GGCT)/AIG2-like uncharacterized protein YtfP
MRGGPLHPQLRGAPLVAVTRTAPKYRLYSVGDRFPGLEPVAAGGCAVAGEVYDVPLAVLRDHLLPAEPAELELGAVELADGSAALAMLLRREFTRPSGLADISATGDWRAYRAGGGSW